MLCEKWEKVYVREASTVPREVAILGGKFSSPPALGIFAAQLCIARGISLLRGR